MEGRILAKFVLEVNNLTKMYKDRAAVDNVSFNIMEGEIFGLIGPNGAGKTTIIKMITGLAKPTSGEVFIDGIQQYVANGIMVTELSVGKHEYEIRASSYKSQSGSFCLASKDKTILTIQLEPEEKKIELSIITTDKDAEIWINGSVCGQGIWNGLIDAGEVQIECSKPKYYS